MIIILNKNDLPETHRNTPVNDLNIYELGLSQTQVNKAEAIVMHDEDTDITHIFKNSIAPWHYQKLKLAGI